MATESVGAKGPSSSSSSSSSSSLSSNGAASYIGSFISLISKSEIRYEGVLYYLNVHDSTIGLNNVRSYGTEGRKKDGSQIPPSDKVFEYILFRGSDIKDLQVQSFPPAQTEEQIHGDPAIIQSRYSGIDSSSSSTSSTGVKTSTESNQWKDTPALTSRVYPGAPSSYQSVTQVGPLDHLPTAEIAGSPSSMQTYWQGHSGTPVSISNPPHQPISFQPPSTGSFPSTMQSLSQAPQIQASTNPSLLNTSEFGGPVSSSISSSSVHPHLSPPLCPIQCSASLDIPSSFFMKSSLPHSASMTANRSTPSSFASSCIDINTSKAQIGGKAISDPRSVLPISSMPCPPSSLVDSSRPLLTPPPSLLISDQLTQSRPYALSSMQKLYPDKSGFSAQTLTPSNSLPFISTSVSQAPLLPLPTSAQQSKHSAAQFTEEFDFMAMNEKFNKDEVWGYLGKANDKTAVVQGYVADQSLAHRESLGLVPNLKPAYNKDEFFDSISCNSLTRGARNAHNRFSERTKLNAETFGNFQQRPNVGYGGFAAGHGENYPASYNWGRGYGYGGRGGGWNMPS
ncbi:hypothetical protein I3843_12G055000 [Carya illinoinensis]|nr:hypothetical protein I3843_12G055000 [Carya illinoinensis]KAG7952374.1 hypothetical protein I3843_12G055000 [Carya illinoinensis]